MLALNEMNVAAYLRRIVSSYLTDRLLKYDTKARPKKYKITEGVSQSSVLGPLL